MKYHVVKNSIELLFIGLMNLSVAIAQPMGQPQPPHSESMSPKEMVRQLKKDLNLTDEQSPRIQKIFEAQREEMRKMFDAAEEEHEAMYEKMDKKREETNAKISLVLTDEQKMKFEKMQKDHAQRPSHPLQPGYERPMREPCPDNPE